MNDHSSPVLLPVPPPPRTSTHLSMPSSLLATNRLGSCGSHATASASALAVLALPETSGQSLPEAIGQAAEAADATAEPTATLESSAALDEDGEGRDTDSGRLLGQRT